MLVAQGLSKLVCGLTCYRIMGSNCCSDGRNTLSALQSSSWFIGTGLLASELRSMPCPKENDPLGKDCVSRSGCRETLRPLVGLINGRVTPPYCDGMIPVFCSASTGISLSSGMEPRSSPSVTERDLFRELRLLVALALAGRLE